MIVITGASAGVGRAAARAFAARGAWLGLLARGQDGLEAAKKEVEIAGSRAITLAIDVADAAAVDRAADAIEKSLGPIDVWVNNAMVTVFAPIYEIAPDELRRVTEVTYLGAAHGTMAALKRMRARNRGTIVQVGSALAYRSIPLQAAYCAAKHAVHGFTESLRTELLHEGSRVHVTEVQLPAINTPQFGWSRAKLPNHPQPVPPIYQPELAADAIVFAACHRRREIWGMWPVIKSIVADKLVPGYADRRAARIGYDAQQTARPLDAERQDNLYQPTAGDHGAHGAFSARACRTSFGLWLSMHRSWLLLAGGACLAALTLRRAATQRLK